jgi:hypothetical protein
MRLFKDDDGVHCLRASIVGVDSNATAQLGDALDAWVATRPDDAASTREIDGRVELEACDRGTAPELLTTELANVPSLRAEMVVAFVSSGADIDLATCVATELLDRVPVELITSDSVSPAQEEELRETATEAASDCVGTS